MYRVTNILYCQRLWLENQHHNALVTRSTSSQPTYTSVISQLPQETYHYEASVEESDRSSYEDEESEIEVEPHDQISQAVLHVQANQPEEQEIIPCQHPHSIFEQDIQIKTKQQDDLLQEEQKETMIQDIVDTTEQEVTPVIDIKEQGSATNTIDTKEDDYDLSIEIVPNDEEVVESLTIDTSSLKMPTIEKEEEELSLISSCSTTPPKTPPSSSHHSSFLNKSKTTTSLFRRETTKLNDRRKSITKKIKSAFHPKPTKRFSI